MTTADLSIPQARRIALAAQGFRDRPHATPTMRTLTRAVERTGVLQIDSVNVLQRAHFMPLYSRMGPYAPELLTRAAESAPRRLVEYWAHVQAYMPVDLWPAMQHRRDHYRAQQHKWFRDIGPDTVREVLAQVADRGPLTAKDLDSDPPRSKENWGWNWSRARVALDFCFMVGDLAIAGRTSQFEPRYDLPERVLPAAVLAVPEMTIADQHVELTRRAIVSHGVGTARDIADYYRMKVADTKAALDTLVEAGEVHPVRIDRVRAPAYLAAGAAMPRTVGARTLLSPFDPVVWERSRAEALFDFNYRIEIYTPAHKRIHGYYVLPFLLGDRIVARTDLKADRAQRRLLVQGVYAEPGAPDSTAFELLQELRRLADWLGLDDIEVAGRGDLAPALAAAQSSSASA